MSASTVLIKTANAAAFIALFAAKYTKTAVGCYTYLTFKPQPVAKDPKYTSADVSVVVPTTFKNAAQLEECIDRILNEGPARVFVVCLDSNVEACKTALKEHRNPGLTILGVTAHNKRVQILKALEYITTDIIVLADDDVYWPATHYLELLLAVFEEDQNGAGGTRQRVRRDEGRNVWNFIGAGYLERRTWNNATTNAIDGSISTLSGRTAAYRAELLQTAEFTHYFLNDSWRGKPLNSDDDKCLTRYTYKTGWKISIQFDPRALLETTVESGLAYLSQCMRWARAHWRGNFTVMENEKYWRSSGMLWGAYVIYAGSFLTPIIMWEALMWFLLHGAVGETNWAVGAYTAFGIFIFISKLVKLIPHFSRYPGDLIYIPCAITFSYFHGFLNVYALLTMTTTHWGSQDLGDKKEKSEARIAVEKAAKAARPEHAVQNATAGHGTQFSEGGRERFRARGQHEYLVMPKDKVKAYREQRDKEEAAEAAKKGLKRLPWECLLEKEFLASGCPKEVVCKYPSIAEEQLQGWLGERSAVDEDPVSTTEDNVGEQSTGTTSAGDPSDATSSNEPNGDTSHIQSNGDTSHSQSNGDTSHNQSNGDTSHNQSNGDNSHSNSNGDSNGDYPNGDSNGHSSNGNSNGDNSYGDSNGGEDNDESAGDDANGESAGDDGVEESSEGVPSDEGTEATSGDESTQDVPNDGWSTASVAGSAVSNDDVPESPAPIPAFLFIGPDGAVQPPPVASHDDDNEQPDRRSARSALVHGALASALRRKQK